MSRQSIYENIKSSVAEDAKLSRDFSLEEPKAPNQISFAPGMIDGAGVVGHYNPGNPKKDAARITKSLRKFLKTGKQARIDEIDKIISETGALSVVDLILTDIQNDHAGIDAPKLIECALGFAAESSNPNLIKLGIALLGLYDFGENSDVTGIIETLALYDEFTLYSVVAAFNWTNGNDIIFRIAKRVDGWGKIQAVERLEPENDEIREWILREGCSNAIMDAYHGVTCAEKGDLINALRKDNMDDRLFDSVSVIMDALLDEGPVAGISEYEHAEEALTLYMSHAEEKAVSLKHLWHILNIRDFIDDSELPVKDDMLARCTAITDNPEWTDKVKGAVERRDEKDLFYACNAAARMDINISALLLSVINLKVG
jgi:hypothetical protein